MRFTLNFGDYKKIIRLFAEINRQLTQPSGSPIEPKSLIEALQSVIDGKGYKIEPVLRWNSEKNPRLLDPVNDPSALASEVSILMEQNAKKIGEWVERTEKEPSPFSLVSTRPLEDVIDAYKQLDEVDRIVWRLARGLDGEAVLSMTEIAELINSTPGRSGRILNLAEIKLAELLRNSFLKDYPHGSIEHIPDRYLRDALKQKGITSISELQEAVDQYDIYVGPLLSSHETKDLAPWLKENGFTAVADKIVEQQEDYNERYRKRHT